jgi:hypothetical protein
MARPAVVPCATVCMGEQHVTAPALEASLDLQGQLWIALCFKDVWRLLSDPAEHEVQLRLVSSTLASLMRGMHIHRNVCQLGRVMLQAGTIWAS